MAFVKTINNGPGKSLVGLVLAAVLAVFLLLVVFGSFYTVDQGTRGV